MAGEVYWSLGFRIDDFTYISDVSRIPPASRELISGTRTLVIDALHGTRVICAFVLCMRNHCADKPHPSHFSIDETVEEVRSINPRYAFLTGFTHRVDHEETQQRIANIVDGTELFMAWDGLELCFAVDT
jgi:phosphoribosyl 1,2-cyclic phosphate phosphodiesterase